MTGQVDDASEKNRSAATSSRKRDDEAGREARHAAADAAIRALCDETTTALVAEQDRTSELRAEMAGLRTQLAEAEARCESHCSAAVHEQLVENFRVLAGQVAAIRALCDDPPAEFYWQVRTLVASSPTTRPTRPESTSPSRTALDPEAKK